MNISILTLDYDPISSKALCEIIADIENISDSNRIFRTTHKIEVKVHSCNSFKDAINTINRIKIDFVILNITSTDVSKHKEDCIQIRNLHTFHPIIAISDGDSETYLEDYSFIGFDDILDINIITTRILLRVILSSLNRSKTHHLFHTKNQRNIISKNLLQLLLDKKSLVNTTDSAAEIIQSQNDKIPDSSTSIFIIKDDHIKRISHSGSTEEESSLEKYKGKILSLKFSTSHNTEFNYFKNHKEHNDKKVRISIPLKNKNGVFALLKIETESGLIHPSEERRYYKDLTETLSDVLYLAQERERFEQVYQQNIRLIDQMSSAAIGIDNNDKVTHWNHQAEEYFGLKKQDAMFSNLFHLKLNCDWPVIISHLYDSLNDKITTERFDVGYKRDDSDKDRMLSTAVTPFVEPNGTYSGYLLLMDDITEKKHMEKRLQQSMYLESIGQLSAGIAHEINTPMQYISDNLNFLQESFSDVARAINYIKKSLLNKTLDEEKLESIFKEADIEYLSEELPLAFSQTTEGVKRVCLIVKAMKEYSHPNSEEKVATNINHCIESTITISKHTWKYHSDMETILDPELPDVMCHPGPFNEVILNIVVNAADAIKDRIENDKTIEKGKITIQTIKKDDFAQIRISDTGGGIPESIQQKIFDPFFTTKAVGKGTGQGLALSYSIIKERHNGELHFETVPGESTTFILQLPYNEQ